MSLAEQLLEAEYARTAYFQTQAHEYKLRVIKLESQRRTLLAHLTLAANCLRETFPGMQARFLDVVKELEKDYEEEFVQSARAASGDSQPDTGSPGPAAGPQVETTAGTAQIPYIDLPAAVRHQQWDSTPAATGELR